MVLEVLIIGGNVMRYYFSCEGLSIFAKKYIIIRDDGAALDEWRGNNKKLYFPATLGAHSYVA